MKNKVVSNLISIGSSLLIKSDTAKLDAQLLLCKCLGYEKTQLVTRQQLEVSEKLINKYYFLIGQRANNIPLAYLVNNKEFFGLNFKISKNVLVPRPETETIIELALKHIKTIRGKLNMIDLGTGSGCIAISLSYVLNKLKRSNFRIDAIDNSIPALETAHTNKNLILGKKNATVRIFKLDYLKKELPGYYDLILANPPYLNDMEYKLMKGTPVSFEPKNALYGSLDGLKYYKRIKILLDLHLKPNGISIVEIGQQSKTELSRIFSKSFQLKFEKDLTGIYRFLVISRQ